MQIFGPVDDVEVVGNAQGSKGFGFLTFLRRRDGERAMQVKSGTIADGRKITVSTRRCRLTLLIPSSTNAGLVSGGKESICSISVVNTAAHSRTNNCW